MNAMEGQMSIFDLAGASGKMSQAHSHREPQRARTSESSLNRSHGSKNPVPLFLDLRKGSGLMPGASWEMGGAWLGAFTPQSFGESPRNAVDSRLSAILVDTWHPKYLLSEKACMGIISRAERREKTLPPELKEALTYQAEHYEEVYASTLAKWEAAHPQGEGGC